MAQDKTAVHQDRLAADADAQATAADRQAVATDRDAVHQDRLAADAAAQATAQDRQATAADRQQTGLDRQAAQQAAANAQTWDPTNYSRRFSLPILNVADWVKLGTWTAQVADRLLIEMTGGYAYSIDQPTSTGGVTFITATMLADTNAAFPNVAGQYSYLGNSACNAVKFVQSGSNRFVYDVFVSRPAYTNMTYRVMCAGTWTSVNAPSQPYPGTAAGSATIADGNPLGTILTGSWTSTNAVGNTLAMRDSGGSLAALAYTAVGAGPSYYWWETDAALNNHQWYANVDGGVLSFGVLNDTGTAGANWLQVVRSGVTVASIQFSAAVQQNVVTLANVSGAFTPNCQLGNEFDCGTLGAAATIASPTNVPAVGRVQPLSIKWTQDGAGGRTMSFGVNCINVGGTSANTAPGKVNFAVGKVYPDGKFYYSIVKGA
ncbi:hypothetical protein [Azospirillum sp. INR13]|uniref:hypothetical protein n=1 Tax=Azospirillum sp. INR13 TaxID=2596919 RepID=UPI0018920918|nr:hypothetical protein [Azospirillum sp. INR13]